MCEFAPCCTNLQLELRCTCSLVLTLFPLVLFKQPAKTSTEVAEATHTHTHTHTESGKEQKQVTKANEDCSGRAMPVISCGRTCLAKRRRLDPVWYRSGCASQLGLLSPPELDTEALGMRGQTRFDTSVFLFFDPREGGCEKQRMHWTAPRLGCLGAHAPALGTRLKTSGSNSVHSEQTRLCSCSGNSSDIDLKESDLQIVYRRGG